jgi:hypothetical protein
MNSLCYFRPTAIEVSYMGEFEQEVKPKLASLKPDDIVSDIFVSLQSNFQETFRAATIFQDLDTSQFSHVTLTADPTISTIADKEKSADTGKPPERETGKPKPSDKNAALALSKNSNGPTGKESNNDFPAASKTATDDLIEKLRDTDFWVRENASKQLKAFPQTQPQLEKKLADLSRKGEKNGDDLEQMYRVQKALKHHEQNKLQTLEDAGWLGKDANGRVTKVYEPGSTKEFLNIEYSKDGQLRAVKFEDSDGRKKEYAVDKDRITESTDGKVVDEHEASKYKLLFDKFGLVITRDGKSETSWGFGRRIQDHPRFQKSIQDQKLFQPK